MNDEVAYPGRLPAHGTRARYAHRSKPCSCDKCKAANTRYQRAKREQHRADMAAPSLFDDIEVEA